MSRCLHPFGPIHPIRRIGPICLVRPRRVHLATRGILPPALWVLVSCCYNVIIHLETRRRCSSVYFTETRICNYGVKKVECHSSGGHQQSKTVNCPPGVFMTVFFIVIYIELNWLKALYLVINFSGRVLCSLLIVTSLFIAFEFGIEFQCRMLFRMTWNLITQIKFHCSQLRMIANMKSSRGNSREDCRSKNR